LTFPKKINFLNFDFPAEADQRGEARETRNIGMAN